VSDSSFWFSNVGMSAEWVKFHLEATDVVWTHWHWFLRPEELNVEAEGQQWERAGERSWGDGSEPFPTS